MSEKVVLTQGQEKELKAFKELGRTLEDWISNKNNPLEPNSELHQLKLDEMAKVLYTGDYEVEKPKFKAGDKVIHCGAVFTLEEKHNLMDLKVYWSFKEACGTIDDYLLIKATPEEIYWLHELGRDKVGDFREGDVLCSNAGDWTVIQERYAHRFNDDGVLKSMKGIYPAESFKPFKKESGSNGHQ